jgi:hypothetical protein
MQNIFVIPERLHHEHLYPEHLYAEHLGRMPCRGMAALSFSRCFDCARLSAQHDRPKSTWFDERSWVPLFAVAKLMT